MRRFSIRTALLVIVILALVLEVVARHRRAVMHERLAAIRALAIAQKQVKQIRDKSKRSVAAAARPLPNPDPPSSNPHLK
jgi:hypothetical protein